MYFPYVRGRQYELLALRELVDKNALSSNIIPIVEPVKLSPTLVKTLKTFVRNEKEIVVIINPEVGTFNSDMNKTNDLNKDDFLSLVKDNNIIKGVIINANSHDCIEKLKNDLHIHQNDIFVINNNKEYKDQYENLFGNSAPRYVCIPDESAFRRQVRYSHNRILLVDRFTKRDRNAAYLEKEDEFFSDDHLFYKEDGFKGFSDYSIIGNDYLETGFAPYAVAIHIVYFKNKDLWVHHFVSDTNDDIQNPAKKFYEAVTKLHEWVSLNNITRTEGLNAFIDHYNNETYPGLGSVKKLSLMHHLELMGKYLDGVD